MKLQLKPRIATYEITA